MSCELEQILTSSDQVYSQWKRQANTLTGGRSRKSSTSARPASVRRSDVKFAGACAPPTSLTHRRFYISQHE